MGVVGTAAGGGKVTVTGLAPEAVKKGTTVTVKSGSRVVQQVTGTLSSGKTILVLRSGTTIFCRAPEAPTTLPGFAPSGGQWMDSGWWAYSSSNKITLTATKDFSIGINFSGAIFETVKSNIPGFKGHFVGPYELSVKKGQYISIDNNILNKMELLGCITVFE